MAAAMTAAAIVLVSFVAMEGVSYATHRWVMHGPAMSWHRSHHRPPAGRFERNDRFPLCFSVVGVALFALASTVAPSLWWVAVGVTGYGVAYLFVHDVYIHRRLGKGLPRVGYLEWLRRSHAFHHRDGGEPFGMLLPIGRRTASASDALLDRASTRKARARL